MTGSAALSEDIAVRTFLVASERGREFSIPGPMRSRFAHLKLASDFIDWGERMHQLVFSYNQRAIRMVSVSQLGNVAWPDYHRVARANTFELLRAARDPVVGETEQFERASAIETPQCCSYHPLSMSYSSHLVTTVICVGCRCSSIIASSTSHLQAKRGRDGFGKVFPCLMCSWRLQFLLYSSFA